MIPWALPGPLLCLRSDPSPGHGPAHEPSWEQAAAAPFPGLFPAGRSPFPSWARLGLAAALPGGSTGTARRSLHAGGASRSCARWPRSQRGAATGTGQRSRTAPWCSGAAGSERPARTPGGQQNKQSPKSPGTCGFQAWWDVPLHRGPDQILWE